MSAGLCSLSCCCCFDQQDSEDEEADVGVALSLDRGPQDQQDHQDHSGFQPYIPEDFANFDIYNAALESQEAFLSSRPDLKGSRCGGTGGGGGVEREVPRSPTASSCTSGYFSHSASNATLSDVPFSASESSDHLSCSSSSSSREPQDAGRGCTQTKSDAPQPPPVSIPNCTDKQQSSSLPHNCVLSASQEFTDFKGADDSMAEGELGWEQPGQRFSTEQPKEAEHVETSGNRVVKSCVPEAAPAAVCKCPNSSVGVVAATQNSTVLRAPGRAPLPVPDKVPALPPAPQLPPSSTALSGAPTLLRAGGEPPIQEPAQGDLPHGSPCPSPNPSSAEPSGDSSGDESTPVAQLPDWMAPGEQVWVGKRRGTVHYVGGVEFAKGIWIGVKLDMAVGECTAQCLVPRK